MGNHARRIRSSGQGNQDGRRCSKLSAAAGDVEQMMKALGLNEDDMDNLIVDEDELPTEAS